MLDNQGSAQNFSLDQMFCIGFLMGLFISIAKSKWGFFLIWSEFYYLVSCVSVKPHAADMDTASMTCFVRETVSLKITR